MNDTYLKLIDNNNFKLSFESNPGINYNVNNQQGYYIWIYPAVDLASNKLAYVFFSLLIKKISRLHCHYEQ